MDERATKLLLKAVRLLPEREQEQVLTALVGASIGAPGPPLFARLSEGESSAALRPAFEPESMSFTQPLHGGAPPDVLMVSQPGRPPAPIEMTGPAAMLPVRLPPELHERLRDWSGEHGFSMAAVVRGLVERFLDEQGGKPRRSAGVSGSKSKSKPAAKSRRPTARG